jgi:hypothetical protein
MIGNSGEINHSPEIAANDSQGTKAHDFVIPELIENDILPPRNFEGQSISNENLN